MGATKIHGFLLALLFSSIMMPAQTLPQLPVDGRIRQGELNCGVTYYLVTNPAVKGFADMAIVRRDGGEAGSARAQLDSLPHFAGRAPWRFLADNGIGCRETGWFDTREGATVFHLDNVPTYDGAVQDSTLLLAFKLIGESPADQALIVSGDIKAQDIVDKMTIFSLTVPPRSGENGELQSAVPADSAAFRFLPIADTLLATVRVTYFTPRTAPAYQNTALPLVSANMFDEMGLILRERIAAALRRHAYPFADIRYGHVGSDRTGGPERHEISVLTDRYHVQAVGSVIAAALASVKAGVPTAEFASAKGRLGPGMARLGREKNFSNAAYIDQCTGAYLHGGNLAPIGQRVSLYARKLPAETEANLFNAVAGALTERRSRLLVEYAALPDSLYELDPLALHALSWDAGAREVPPPGHGLVGDTLSFAAGERTKLKKTAPELLTGGELWTFANGMQVIFKKMGSGGSFSYALFVKGGYNTVADLLPGEGGFFSDLLGCFDVAGMRGPDFFATLAANGVEMQPEVSASGLAIKGSAPYNKLGLTLRALVSLANARRYHPQTVQDYLREEAFRLRAADPAGKLAYDAVYPSYKLSPYKDAERLSPAVARKAEKYFNDRFQNLQDGVLVICGDLATEPLKKMLASCVGAFRIGRGSAVRRAAPAEALPGFRTLTLADGTPRAEVFVTAPLAYTATHHIAARIALLALRRQLVAALSPQGFSFELEGAFATYPAESFQLRIRCRPACPDGLPASFGAADFPAMQAALREALAHTTLSPADFNAFKAAIVQEMSAELEDPDALVRAVLVRHAEGKDLVSRFAEQAQGVTLARVEEILSALAAGSRAEILVP